MTPDPHLLRLVQRAYERGHRDALLQLLGLLRSVDAGEETPGNVVAWVEEQLKQADHPRK